MWVFGPSGFIDGFSLRKQITIFATMALIGRHITNGTMAAPLVVLLQKFTNRCSAAFRPFDLPGRRPGHCATVAAETI
ncbi:MAG: hypothetical protein ACI8QT_000386 [Halioglobus sp.]